MKRLVITGTGRAGTTWMVEWLRAAGLDCGDPLSEYYDEAARAGRERCALDVDAPAVVKDPWLWTYVDRLDPATVAVLVMPVRRLEDAAKSRQTVEGVLGSGVSAHTPGGMLYSTLTVDLTRLLSVAFYTALQWAVEHNVPVQLLDFEQMMDNPQYAAEKMYPWCPGASMEELIQAHRRTVNR